MSFFESFELFLHINKTDCTQTHFWIIIIIFFLALLLLISFYYSPGKIASKQTNNVVLDCTYYMMI